MKKILFTMLVCLAAMSALTSCKGCSSDVRMLQNVSGKPGEIIVVIDKDQWEGAAGDLIRQHLEAEYQVLPQKEPKFTLYNIAPMNFSDIFRIHRNILVINVSADVQETRMHTTRDVWAAPQTIIKVNARNGEEAAKCLGENIGMIESIFEQAERDRIIANNIKFQQSDIRPVVSALAGGSPYFPMGYSVKKASDEFIWVSYETTFISQYVFVYKYPVTGEDDLSTQRIVSESNAMLKANVPGPVEDSYMILSALPAPQDKYIKYNNRDFVEIRGLWEVQNDYMGGPYVLHAFYDKDQRNVIVLHAFVYAPKYDKRNYLRQVESIIYSFQWEDEK